MSQRLWKAAFEVLVELCLLRVAKGDPGHTGSRGVTLDPRPSPGNAKRILTAHLLLNRHFRRRPAEPLTCSLALFLESKIKRFRLKQQISDDCEPDSSFSSCCGATQASPSPSARRAVKSCGCTISLLITQKLGFF